MKKALTLIVISALGLSLVATASAQAAGPQGGAPKAGFGNKANERRGMGPLLAKLDLTKDQMAKIKEINKAFQEKVKQIRKDNPVSTDKNDRTPATIEARKALREKLKPINEQHTKDIMAVLTDDQKTKLKELIKQQAEEARKNRQAGKGGGAAGTGGGTKTGGGI